MSDDDGEHFDVRCPNCHAIVPWCVGISLSDALDKMRTAHASEKASWICVACDRTNCAIADGCQDCGRGRWRSEP